MINGLVLAALESKGLLLANRIAPLISASILACYAFRGRTIGIVQLSPESEAIVRSRNGGELSPVDNWRKYFWGGGGN